MSLLDLVVAYVGGSLDSSGLVAKLKELGYSESEAQEYVRSAEGARGVDGAGDGGHVRHAGSRSGSPSRLAARAARDEPPW